MFAAVMCWRCLVGDILHIKAKGRLMGVIPLRYLSSCAALVPCVSGCMADRVYV